MKRRASYLPTPAIERRRIAAFLVIGTLIGLFMAACILAPLWAAR